LRDIKYTELVFKLKFLENVTLPKYKVLMLNGALLNILLSLYCINKRKCDSCNIVSRCLIQKLLGNSYEANKPLILQSHNIQPYYLIDCSNEKRSFNQDQEFTFSIRLINEAIDYISQFIYAFDQSGSIGLGESRAKYNLIGVYNNKDSPIFENGILYEANIHIQYISDYIRCRKQSVKGPASLEFITPFRPDQTSFRPYFNVNDLYYSVKNRLKNLGVIEEQDIKLLDQFGNDENITSFSLNIIKQSYPIKKLGQEETIIGFKGKINFSREAHNLIDYLIACEKICIGNHIILGYGRFTIEGEGQDVNEL